MICNTQMIDIQKQYYVLMLIYTNDNCTNDFRKLYLQKMLQMITKQMISY